MGFLAKADRVKYRSIIKHLAHYELTARNCLKVSAQLPDTLFTAISALTNTEDLERQYVALTDIHDTYLKQYRAKLRGAAKEDYLAFYEYMNIDQPPAAHHELLGEVLMDMENRVVMRALLSLPPGSAKSTYCSHYFPAWYLGRNPTHKYIQAGHTQEFCENEFGKKTRGIVESADFQDVFPDVRLSEHTRAAGAWKLSNMKGAYLTKGVGQGISGYRGNFAGVDDPFASRADAEAAGVRKKVFEWFKADLSTRLLPESPMLVVATRWHPDDLIGRLEDESKEGKGLPWKVINLPAICEDPDTDPLKRRQNESIWPEFYSFEWLMEKKSSLPSRDWNSLYMGKPVDEEGGIIKLSQFGRYDSVLRDEISPAGALIKQNVRRTVISVDCANKATERADFSVVTVWRESFDYKHHLVDVIRRRVEFNDLISMIEGTAKRWHASAILVEDKGSGTQYCQVRKGLAPAPVIPISVNNESKQFRFDGVSPMIEQGLVILPSSKMGSLWLPEYEAEILAFPNAKHDDQVDSTSQYLAWCKKRVKRGTIKMKGTV